MFNAALLCKNILEVSVHVPVPEAEPLSVPVLPYIRQIEYLMCDAQIAGLC